MLVDGIQVVEDSLITKKIINPSKRGLSFPSNPSKNDRFELTALKNGKRKGIYRYDIDQSDWLLESPDSSFVPYDVSGYISGKLESNDVLNSLLAIRDFRISADFFGSMAIANTASVATSVINIVKIKSNGMTENLGTLNFSAGNNKGVFVSAKAGDIEINRGEILQLIAPSVADTSLANISFTLAGFLV